MHRPTFLPVPAAAATTYGVTARHWPWRLMGAALATLALMAGLLTTGATAASAAAQTDFGPPDLINLSVLTVPATNLTGIPVAAGIYSATPAQVTSLENLETQAVNNTISDHSLARGDNNAVLSWARSDADAELWALLVQAMQAVAAHTATTDQTNAVDWLTAVAQREGVLSARAAGLEYAKWAGLGISAWNNLINSNNGSPSQAALATFLGGTPVQYTDGGSATNPNVSIDGGYCVYSPPSPDQGQYTSNINGTTPDQTCFTPCTNVFGCNLPTPTLQQFENWGEADVAQGLFNNASFATTSQNVAESASMEAAATGGSVAAGIGSTFALSGVMSGTAFQQAVFPFAARAFANIPAADAEAASEAAGESATEAAEGALDTAAEIGGEVAATGVGAIVAAVIFAVITAVQEGLIVFTGDALPSQLASFIAQAPGNTPDLTSMLNNNTEMQGLYNLFIGSTLPTPTFTTCNNNTLRGLGIVPCDNATTVPAQSSADPQWVITPQGSSTSTTQPTLTWQDAASGLTTTTFLHGNWFVGTSTINSTQATVQSLRFQYTDWQGKENTAWLFANDNPPEFLTVPNSSFGESFNPGTCVSTQTCSVTTTIDIVGANGKNYSASVAPGGLETPPLPPNPLLCSQLPSNATPAPGINCASSLQPSSTTLTSSPAVAQVGQPVTLIAFINAGVDSAVGATVEFSNGPTDYCRAAPVNFGLNNNLVLAATCTTTFTATGKYVIFGTFSGDLGTFSGEPGDQPSQGELTLEVVNRVSTTTAASASTTTPVVGQPVTYTATVSDSGPAPTGTVTFTNGSTTACSDVALSTTPPNTATCSQTYRGVGGQTVSASYSGDDHTKGSQDQVTVTVGQASSGTSVSASTSSPVVGEPVQYTATVSTLAPDTAGPAPTGTVTFTNGSTTVCSDAALSTTPPNTATCSQTYQAIGGQTVSASYSGDANTIGSQSQAQVTVVQASTSTGLSMSPSAPTFGQPVTFTASVSAVAPSTAGPALTGTVTFTLDGQPLATGVPFNGAQAQSVPVYNLAPGPHSVVATYSGDDNYIGSRASSSPTVTCSQTITAAHSGSLTVTGSTCIEAGGSVSGPVTVMPGGALAVIGGTLNGPVTGNGVASVLICGTTVGGPMSLTGTVGPVALGGSSGSACGPDQFNGPVNIDGSNAAVSIEASTINGAASVAGGSGPVTITGDSLGGPLSVTSNSGTVNVSSNTVGGPVTVSSNSSPSAATVSANTITGRLICEQNTVAPTDAGVLNESSGPATGQCAMLG